MARRRKVTTPWGLGEISATPVKMAEGYETRQQFYERLEREERERQEAEQKRIEDQKMAPVRTAEKQLHAAAREASERVKKFFSLPLQKMGEFMIDSFPCDPIGDYPVASSVDNRADLAAQNAFKDSLASRGCTLGEDGLTRLGAYLEVLRLRGVTLADTRSWEMALDRLYSLGCFASGEVTGYTPQPVQSVEHHQPIVDPTAESKSNLDELLRTTSAESREGRKILERAVGEEVQKTVREVFSQFHAEAIREFGQAFTESDIAAIIRVMKLHNLPQTGKAFSQARYLAASAGYISEKFLNADEKLALELDRLDRPMTFEEKRAFNRKVAALHKGTPLLG